MTTAPIGKLMNLLCTCCGARLVGRQWHNQDTGYGLCDACVDMIRLKPDYQDRHEFERTYGYAGIHYKVNAAAETGSGYDALRHAYEVSQGDVVSLRKLVIDLQAENVGVTAQLIGVSMALLALGKAIEGGDPQEIADVWIGKCARALAQLPNKQQKAGV